MKRIFITQMLLLFGFLSHSQDTIKVQTFDWKSTIRRDSFDFPNDNTSYRKILMLYNMRCHNAAVGNGNVGCYEWDYSCNTFITDPSRIDSAKSSHPDYVISNFNGTDFNYTRKPTYQIFKTTQHNSTLSGNMLSEGAIGKDNKIIELGGRIPSISKAQYLYKANELLAAGLNSGNIFNIKLDIGNSNSELTFFRIRMKQISSNLLEEKSPELEGFTEVYYKDTKFNVGINDLHFYQPFKWDGISNILVEFSFTSNPILPFTLKAHEADFDASLFNNQADNHLYFKGIGSVSTNGIQFSSISNEVTVSLWCYGAPNLPDNTVLFEGLDTKLRRQINVHLPWSDGNVYFDCGADASGNYDRISKAANINEYSGKWNHWAFTKNAITGEMKIFLNGNLWHSGTGMKRTIDIKSFVIAASGLPSLNYYGSIDDFQIWNKALDQQTIRDWMYHSELKNHPNYSSLLANYNFNEGVGKLTASTAPNGTINNIFIPTWRSLRGVDLFKNFQLNKLRPNIVFTTGNYLVNDKWNVVYDSIINSQNQVINYKVIGTDLVIIDTQYVFKADFNYIYNENGDKIDSSQVMPEGTFSIKQLNYYKKQPAKFELLSLVTPYGNGLNLGVDGKLFTFDVTDFAPILKGRKFLSVEYGGENQEELDIKFLFIKGTPPRKVLDIQNVWAPNRGWFGDIQSDAVFESRKFTLNPNASSYKLRSAITGHGQNGEFVPREHFININGGNQEFKYDVWKYCGKNPIYPQGGTWVFDRAGWCPGMASDVHEFEMIPFVTPGQEIEIDYGINGENLSEANYLVSTQLITYDKMSYNLDASIELIKRPNNKSVEYARLNPACNTPTIVLRNTGVTTITSLEFKYQVLGGNALTYNWTGTIKPLETIDIVFPLASSSFWLTSNVEKVFQVQIVSVNNTPDDNSENNIATSSFTPAKEYIVSDPLQLRLKTNNIGSDNYYSITDQLGNVVLSRDNLDNNTTYVDRLEITPGCYTLKFEDISNDGLNFWFFPNNGSGSLRLERVLNPNTQVAFQGFNADMGGGVQFDFVYGKITDVAPFDTYKLFSLYPNPVIDELTMEFHGYKNQIIEMELMDITGKRCFRQQTRMGGDQNKYRCQLKELKSGIYLMKVNLGNAIEYRQIIKE